jgi:hypothetical protein
MVFDVNKRETEELILHLEESRKDIPEHLIGVLAKARDISGFAVSGDLASEPFLNGRYQREGYTVGKYSIKGEGDYVIPLLLFVPDGKKEKLPALLYLHPEGKAAEALVGGEIEKLVKEGYLVAAVDVMGIGEAKNKTTRPLATGYTALLIGRSVVGIQAGDIISTAGFLKSLDCVDKQRVGAFAVGETCIPLLHAAAFDPSIASVTLVGSQVSYRSVAMNRFYKFGLIENEGGGTGHPYEVEFNWGIAGVLKGYDLPDLMGCIAPRKLVLAALQNQQLEDADRELIERDTAFPQSVYNYKKVPGNLSIVSSKEDIVSLVNWAFE